VDLEHSQVEVPDFPRWVETRVPAGFVPNKEKRQQYTVMATRYKGEVVQCAVSSIDYWLDDSSNSLRINETMVFYPRGTFADVHSERPRNHDSVVAKLKSGELKLDLERE